MLAKANQWFTRLTDHPDGGKLLLRITMAVLMLFHGTTKILWGIDKIIALVASKGLPAFVAYGVYIGEFVAPILILLGIFTRPAALIYVINMMFAILLVSTGKMGMITEVGAWGIETPALFLLGGLVIMLLGSGRYSVMKNPDYR